MNNIKLVIQYDGTRYNGWQKQKEKGKNITTIQGKLEHVLSKMTDEDIQLIGCGRTDAGVHADNFVANFTTNSIKPLEKIKEYLDEYLPEDIIIKEVKLASPRFHARYNVKSKSYVYKINNNENNDVFTRKYAYHVKEKLNIEDMKSQIRVLPELIQRCEEDKKNLMTAILIVKKKSDEIRAEIYKMDNNKDYLGKDLEAILDYYKDAEI